MDLSVTLETRKLPIGERLRSITSEFRERDLFPLVKVIRVIEEDKEIIDICVLGAERSASGELELVAKQVEIVRILEQGERHLSVA